MNMNQYYAYTHIHAYSEWDRPTNQGCGGEGEGEGENDIDVITTTTCYILPIDCLAIALMYICSAIMDMGPDPKAQGPKAAWGPPLAPAQ